MALWYAICYSRLGECLAADSVHLLRGLVYDENCRANTIFNLREHFPLYCSCPSKFATPEEVPKTKPAFTDDMKRMNVEQLDDAFRLSLVDASTMVWKAGMKTWQSLGAVAGIDDEPETVVRWIEPPPPPRPIGRPAPRPPSPRSLAPVAASYHTAVTPVFAAPLVAPVYTPHLHAPDPYVLPKRRVSIPSEVDFRRASGGVHWGRWLIALLLITGGVLGAYRQNLLRDGARRLGIENKYLYNEHRVTAFVPVLEE